MLLNFREIFIDQLSRVQGIASKISRGGDVALSKQGLFSLASLLAVNIKFNLTGFIFKFSTACLLIATTASAANKGQYNFSMKAVEKEKTGTQYQSFNGLPSNQPLLVPTYSASDYEARRKPLKDKSSSKQAEMPAVDLKIGDWSNRERLKIQLAKDVQKDMAALATYEAGGKRPFSKKQLDSLRATKKILELNFQNDVVAYVESILPQSINVLDKKNFYVLAFVNPTKNDHIEILNQLQKDYQRRLTVCGVIRPLVPLIDVVRTEKNQDMKKINGVWIRGKVDPKVYHAENVKALDVCLESLGEDMPRFLLGIDEDCSRVNDVVIKKYFDILDEEPRVPQVYVINDRANIVWTGEANELLYYIDDILKNKFKWSHYLEAYKARKQIPHYLTQVSSSRQRQSGVELGERIFEELKSSPHNLMEFAKEILAMNLYQYRDVPLALKCARQANKVTGGNNKEVLKLLSTCLYEFGLLDFAIKKARQARQLGAESDQLDKWQKIHHSLGRKAFKHKQQAKMVFSKEYWPSLVSRSEQPLLTEDADKIIFRGLKSEPVIMADIVFHLMRSKAISQKKGVMNLSEKMVKEALRQLPNNQDVLAAHAMFELRNNKFSLAKKLMEKALSINPESEKASSYEAILTHVMSKKKS